MCALLKTTKNQTAVNCVVSSFQLFSTFRVHPLVYHYNGNQYMAHKLQQGLLIAEKAINQIYHHFRRVVILI